MQEISENIRWAGYPASANVLLDYVKGVLSELDRCTGIHYSFMPSRSLPVNQTAVNFRFRLTWVFSGTLRTTAAFERHWESRYIRAGELFLSGTGGYDQVDIAGGDCRALAILFYARHTRLVFSEFRSGRVCCNPYYHTGMPDSDMGARLLDVLNHLLKEPEEIRRPRVLPLCRALLEQLVLDVSRDQLASEASGNQLVNRMLTCMQLCFHLPVSCSSLCADLKINRTYASELFHRITGRTVKEYLLRLRLEKAEWLLCCYDLSMEEVAGQCGFSGANYFIRIFREHYGISPGAFRKKHRNSDPP